MSKTEDRYKAAGLKPPRHTERVTETLTHVDPEVQPVDALKTPPRPRGARSARSPRTATPTPTPADTKNQEA